MMGSQGQLTADRWRMDALGPLARHRFVMFLAIILGGVAVASTAGRQLSLHCLAPTNVYPSTALPHPCVSLHCVALIYLYPSTALPASMCIPPLPCPIHVYHLTLRHIPQPCSLGLRVSFTAKSAGNGCAAARIYIASLSVTVTQGRCGCDV